MQVLEEVSDRAVDVQAGPSRTSSRPDSRSSTLCLNCPRCGLRIEVRARWLAIRHCPRCVARTRSVVELSSSRRPDNVLYATDSLPQARTESPATTNLPASRHQRSAEA
jgi:hypothetical protein